MLTSSSTISILFLGHTLLILSQNKADGRPLAFHTVRPDFTAMLFNNFLRNGKPQAAAALGGISRGIRPVTPFKNTRQFILRDAPAVILNLYLNKFRLIFNKNADPSGFCSHIFHRITHDVIVFLSLLRAETITHFKLPVYCYQLGVEGQSVSIDGIRKHYFDKSKVANQIYNWYRENNPDSYQGFHKKLLLREILGITNDAYCAYMTLENVKIGKKELIDFDKNMKKEFPEIYKETMSVKKIRLLRETHFLAFHYLRKRYLKVFGSN